MRLNVTIIIAEIGVNHNGEEDIAFELVKQAKLAGADIVKFQTFKAIELVTSSAKQASYQTKNTKLEESQLNMLSRLELSYGAHRRLMEYCNELDITFLSTAFDFESLNFLHHDLKLRHLKIGSGELTNAPLLLAHARTGSRIILSTGMANLADIELALSVLAFGYLDKNTPPTLKHFELAYLSEQGQAKLQKNVTLLHCTSQYPAPLTDINLKVLNTLKNTFNLSVGYSDHTAGITIPIAAAAMGARVIEKHFTLDQNLPGPDHKASITPSEFTDMVKGVRDVEVALGSSIKYPQLSEFETREVARKSLVASQNILKGEYFNESNLVIKRPGHGLSPVNYWLLLGQKAQQNYQAGDLIVN